MVRPVRDEFFERVLFRNDTFKRRTASDNRGCVRKMATGDPLSSPSSRDPRSTNTPVARSNRCKRFPPGGGTGSNSFTTIFETPFPFEDRRSGDSRKSGARYITMPPNRQMCPCHLSTLGFSLALSQRNVLTTMKSNMSTSSVRSGARDSVERNKLVMCVLCKID
ncbi:HEAT repeat-containing protein 2 [Anopheles sinensis]|uniref:HEAT repeat-containing protein 2 n=1 Tax=Anopheles sinensis TaxID=74873 RepID=A0A084VV88_ANOSI|nr:HEAT repeat-containing protein 2 [Anopheles sinensis]